MEHLTTPLEKHLLELLEPSTTPEKALQLLSIPCFLPMSYSNDNEEHVVIFLAYIRFIIMKLPEACVDGIWEDFLWRALKYSQNFCGKHKYLYYFLKPNLYIMPDMYCRIVHTEGLKVQLKIWLNDALSSESKCPNPYLRLELFRLVRIFNPDNVLHKSLDSRKCICYTFIYTICQIQPLRLYPGGNVDDILFSAIDLKIVFSVFFQIEYGEYLPNIIVVDLIAQFIENGEVIEESLATKFISHCIQIIGGFAVLAGAKLNHNIQFNELQNCLVVFRQSFGRLVACKDLSYVMTSWMQFRYIVARPPFQRHIVETFHDITVAIVNCKQGQIKEHLMSLRDSLAEELGVCLSNYKVPNLLFSLQIHGPRLAHQQFILLGRLAEAYKNRKNSIE
ncbi:unnamed protein product, partial [Meganyctiphanes norvegica]